MNCVTETLYGNGRGWQASPEKFATVTMWPGDLFLRNWRATSRFMVILRPSFPRKAMGWALLVLGVLGLVLPFLQGFLFLAFGVFVLRDQHVWAARRWAWVAGRWPQMVGKLEAMEISMAARMRHFAKRLRLRG